MIGSAMARHAAHRKRAGVTWHVDSSTGSNANSGKTAGAAFATIQFAHDQTNPGDTVVIHPGSGYGGGTGGAVVATISRDGTAAAPITYVAAPGTRPVISGTRAWQVFYFTQASYIVIRGLEFAGWNSAITDAAAFQNSANFATDPVYSGNALQPSNTTPPSHHITIDDCWIHGFPGAAISWSTADYVTVTRNKIYDNGWFSGYGTAGLTVNGSKNADTPAGPYNHYIIGNECYNNFNIVGFNTLWTTRATVASTASGSVVALNNTASFLVNQHVFDRTNGAAIPRNTYITAVSTNVSITLSNALTGTVGIGDTLVTYQQSDGEGIIMDTNTGYTGKTLIANNLCYNNGCSGILVTQSPLVDIIFNTCWGNQQNMRSISAGGDIYIGGSASSVNVFNNVVYTTVAGLPSYKSDSSTSFASGNNVWFGGNNTPPGTGNVHVDPGFINAATNPATRDFRVTSSGSSLVNAASASWTIGYDKDGVTRPIGAARDCGCYECF